MSIYREEGQAVFVHQCELRRHALTVSWGAGYPAVDLNSMPQVHLPGGKTRMCQCGGEYQRVEPCQGLTPHERDEKGGIVRRGDHDCHPIAGHVVRSDDPTAGLIPVPEPDPLHLLEQRRDYVRWVIETQRAIAQFENLLRVDDFPSAWHREDCELSLNLARANLAQGLAAPAAKVTLTGNGHKEFKLQPLPKPIEVTIDLSPDALVGDPDAPEEWHYASAGVEPRLQGQPVAEEERTAAARPSPASRARSFVRWWFTGER